MKIACLLIGKTLRIVVGAKTHFFETPPGCGLGYTTADGNEKKAPGPRDPFWTAVDLWSRQGSRMDGDLCVWDQARPSHCKLIGNDWVPCKASDPDAFVIYDPPCPRLCDK